MELEVLVSFSVRRKIASLGDEIPVSSLVSCNQYVGAIENYLFPSASS